VIRQPGSPLALRLFVGRLDGMDDPVVALIGDLIGDAGPRVLAVLVDDEAEMALAELLALLPEAALSVGDTSEV
jgi:hypothetical protein